MDTDEAAVSARTLLGGSLGMSARSALVPVGLSLLAVASLYAVSTYSFVLFHGIVELFAAAVAIAIFLVTWHSRRFLDNYYVGIVGVAYLGVGAVGLLHTLAYRGMNVFPGATSDLPTQLWLVDRYLAAAAFLIAPLFIRRRADLRIALVAYIAVSAAAAGLVFAGVFPQAFVEGSGLTPFKIVSEYVIIVVLGVALLLLMRRREAFDPRIWRLLAWSIVMSAAAEMAFTLYTDPFGPFNLAGHLLYVGAFFLVYMALIKTTLEDPYSVLFRRLRERESELETAISLSEGLNRAAEAIGSTLDFDHIMRRVVVVAAEALSADAMVVSMSTPEGWTMRYVYGCGPEMVGRRVSRQEGLHITEAIARHDVVTVEDTEAKEARGIVHRPFFQTLGMRAFATVPLMLRDETIGVMSFHFRQPRRFHEVERLFIRKLAAFMTLATENARLYEADHEVAETLQSGLRPSLEDVPGVETGSEYLASPGVGTLGGDFFDVFPVDDMRIALMIGDVSGKGIRAATTTATVRGAVRALAYVDPQPVAVLNALNTTLERRGLDSGFVTLLYAVLDVENGKLDVGIAGHPAPHLCGRDTQPDFETIIDPPLGLFPDRPYHSVQVRLERGEAIVMYTDGVIDARAEGTLFGDEGVRRSLEGCADVSAQSVASSLAEAAARHAGGRLMDDMAVLVVRFTGA